MVTETCRSFESALRELCRRHGVRLAPSASGDIGVWNLDPDDVPFEPLADRTDGSAAPVHKPRHAGASVLPFEPRRRRA